MKTPALPLSMLIVALMASAIAAQALATDAGHEAGGNVAEPPPVAIHVNPLEGDDAAAGSAEAPLKTIDAALGKCSGGEIITLADGNYPAVAISKDFPQTVTVRAANAGKAVMTGGVAIAESKNISLQNLRFGWTEETRPKRGMTPFIDISQSKNVEVADCEIADQAEREVYAGLAVSVTRSDGVMVRDSNIHHVYFGISFYQSTNCTARNLTIGPWSHEDGIRVMQCEGPVLIDGCRISNAGNRGRKTGHVDAIQVVYGSNNLTVRNSVIHNVSQAIGAFNLKEGERKNWRIEGNLIYDVYTPHVCTIVQTDGLAVINNTFPQGSVTLSKCTGSIVRNNIFRDGSLPVEGTERADHNLWMEKSGDSEKRKQVFDESDLAGIDPQFVNAPKFFTKCDYWGKGAKEQFTDRRLSARETLEGKIALGDQVEILIADGRPRDGVLRKVVRVEGKELEFDPPTDVSMKGQMVLIYNWGAEPTSTKPDYRLRSTSPAIDSAAGDVNRTADMDGKKPVDAPEVPNRGSGQPAYRDRGAFEFAPQ